MDKILPPGANLPSMAQVVTASGIRIHALRTGWVGVKKTHRELNVPRALAIPSIMLGAWADWMPIIVYVVVHPEAIILVDTGPSPLVNDHDYYACDKHNEFFYKRNLRFIVPEHETLGPRLNEIGIDPSEIQTLLITHFHGDHIGCVDLVRNAKALTGAGNWPSHVGSFTCRLPKAFVPKEVSFANEDPSHDTANGATYDLSNGVSKASRNYGTQGSALLASSKPLTSDGKVRIVSLPGHTPGHIGCAVLDGNRIWLMVGDATFDQDQTDRKAVCGVSQDIDQARATQSALRELTRDPSLVMLPSHDLSVFSRLS